MKEDPCQNSDFPEDDVKDLDCEVGLNDVTPMNKTMNDPFLSKLYSKEHERLN